MHPIVHVAPNDTTSSIAGRLGVSNLELVLANPHRTDVGVYGDLSVFLDLVVGDELLVPERVANQFVTRGGRQAVRTGGQADVTLGLGPCPKGQKQLAPGVCVPDGSGTMADKPQGSDCQPGWRSLMPGFCVPDTQSGSTQDKPQGACPDGWKQMMPNVCVPPGIPNVGGGETIPAVPCPPGFKSVSPGICIPESLPTGQTQGPCGPNQVQVVPGLCVPTGLPNITPGSQQTNEYDCSKLGPNVYPYVDPQTKEPMCLECHDDEFLGANGLCYCKSGSRSDPNDVNSPCTTPVNKTGGSGEITKGQATAYCADKYGTNSAAILIDNQWECNVCRPEEFADPTDGKCMCRPGTERQDPKNPDSPCVPSATVTVPAGYTKIDAQQSGCTGSNLWVPGQGCYAPPKVDGGEGITSEKKDEGISWGAVGAGAGIMALAGLGLWGATKAGASAGASAGTSSGTGSKGEEGASARASNPVKYLPASMSIEARRKRAAKILHEWHGDMGDPIYAVGSYYLSGREYPDKAVIKRAATELERLSNLDSSKGDRTKMREVAAFLKHEAK